VVPLTGRRALRVLRIARILQPAGALAAILAFVAPKGVPAGALALGWFAVCAIAGIAGILELAEARSLRPEHLLAALRGGTLLLTRDAGESWSRLPIRLPDAIDLAVASA